MPGKIRFQESNRRGLYWEEAREHVFLEKVRTHLLFGGDLLHTLS